VIVNPPGVTQEVVTANVPTANGDLPGLPGNGNGGAPPNGFLTPPSDANGV